MSTQDFQRLFCGIKNRMQTMKLENEFLQEEFDNLKTLLEKEIELNEKLREENEYLKRVAFVQETASPRSPYVAGQNERNERRKTTKTRKEKLSRHPFLVAKKRPKSKKNNIRKIEDTVLLTDIPEYINTLHQIEELACGFGSLVCYKRKTNGDFINQAYVEFSDERDAVVFCRDVNADKQQLYFHGMKAYIVEHLNSEFDENYELSTKDAAYIFDPEKMANRKERFGNGYQTEQTQNDVIVYPEATVCIKYIPNFRELERIKEIAPRYGPILRFFGDTRDGEFPRDLYIKFDDHRDARDFWIGWAHENIYKLPYSLN
jgi:hypothetical protein